MKKFLITEEEKSNILGMYFNPTGKNLVNEVVTPYDPWKEVGGRSIPTGLKFKSVNDWSKFTDVIPVSFTQQDGPNFPHIMVKNPQGVYQMKDYDGQTAQASIANMGIPLFIVAASQGKSNILSESPAMFNYWYKANSIIINNVDGGGPVISSAQLQRDLANKKNNIFVDIQLDWANIIKLKLDPVYQKRYATHAIPASPTQK
jgi:hypothetical protein